MKTTCNYPVWRCQTIPIPCIVICFAVAEPSSGYRFHVSTTLSLLLWSYLILSDTHVFSVESKHNRLATSDVCFGLPSSWLRWHAQGTALAQNLNVRDLFFWGTEGPRNSWVDSCPYIIHQQRTIYKHPRDVINPICMWNDHKKQWMDDLKRDMPYPSYILYPIPFHYHHLKHITHRIHVWYISLHLP